MTEKQIVVALRKRERGQNVDPGTAKFLYTNGYSQGSTTITNHQSKETEYLLTYITEKGQELLARYKDLAV